VSAGLYMDVPVPNAITHGLILRGVDVLTAQADGTTRLEDPALLDRATELGRVLFTEDEDLSWRRPHGDSGPGSFSQASSMFINWPLTLVHAFAIWKSSPRPECWRTSPTGSSTCRCDERQRRRRHRLQRAARFSFSWLHGTVEGLGGQRGRVVVFDEAGGGRGVRGEVGPSAGHAGGALQAVGDIGYARDMDEEAAGAI